MSNFIRFSKFIMSVDTTVTELFNTFAKAMKEEKTLTKKNIGELFKDTLRPFVEKTFKEKKDTAKKSRSTKKDSDSDSGTKKRRLPLSTWASIFPSKTVGLATHFKEFVAENDLKDKKPSMVVHLLRNEFEGTERWDEFLEWVREKNKNTPDEDPKPECSTWQTVLQSGCYGLAVHFDKDAEDIRDAEPGIRHFSITSQLRDKYEFADDGENTKEWKAYLKWVSKENKNCPEGEPSPRGEKKETKKKAVAKKTPAKDEKKAPAKKAKVAQEDEDDDNKSQVDLSDMD